jgi:thiamine-phosphate diphosphorylase
MLARSCGKVFIVNSLLDLAREGKADGVHLTSKQGLAARLDLTDEERGGFLVGKSVHSLQEARAAEAEGADYVLLSPIFSPLSKTVSRPPLGLETLRETTRLLRIPVFALGGVHAGHLDLVHQNGAAGVAGITWLREEVKRVMRWSGPSR